MGRPSAFFDENLDRLRDAARLGPIADLACGRGRHTLAGARAGLPMVGLDRNGDFLATIRSAARAEKLNVALVRTDLEAGFGLPLRPNACGAIIVFRFLHRPLARHIVEALVPGGLLLYETFSTGQRELGLGPRNPDFLLQPGELPELFGGYSDLELLARWEGLEQWPDSDHSAAIGRLMARRI